MRIFTFTIKTRNSHVIHHTGSGWLKAEECFLKGMGVLKSSMNVMNLSLLRKWLPKKKELFFRNQIWSRKKVWRTWPNGHLGSAERHLCDGLLMPVLLKSDMERGSAASKPGNLVRVRSPWTPAATPPLSPLAHKWNPHCSYSAWGSFSNFRC